MSEDYWFARRFPLGHPRSSMSPINAQGWVVVRTFLAWMIGGVIAAVAFSVICLLWVPVPFLWIAGPLVFAVAAGVGGYIFIASTQTHGDKLHCVADYKAGRVQ